MDTNQGIQKFHSIPTPRIGGMAIVAALWVAWLNAPPDLKSLIGVFLLAGLPAFMFGLAEDITKKVSVSQRLLATMASGLLAWWLTDYSLTRVDVWGIDYLLSFTLVSALFTSFAVGGVANSINIIDGFNGLAATTSTLAFASFAFLAYRVGDSQLAAISLVLAACIWGFFWINWPYGKIFLGDGGSYFVGFSLAWVAVMLIERNSQVSAFAAAVICVHPITEVLFSIYRRKIKKLHPGHPDRMHFHSLIKQRYVRRWFSGVSTEGRNSITGLLVGLMTLTSGILANCVYQSVWMSTMTLLILMLGYVSIYARMVRYKWCSPINFLMFKPIVIVRR
jgi:UDP-N-acetylmuramyl pentapeptide phosphotransferase/UDP-N-acetylglucosamine-1-phosphate transferase